MRSYIKPYQRSKYELCCNIAVYIYIENRLFSPLLACFSIFVVVFGGFQFASEFTIVTVIVCFLGGLCFGETEATLCVSFVTFCYYITYNYHYWLEVLNFNIDTWIHFQKRSLHPKTFTVYIQTCWLKWSCQGRLLFMTVSILNSLTLTVKSLVGVILGEGGTHRLTHSANIAISSPATNNVPH